ncbi:uncharacterized protein LOC134296777 [Anolis carolinensis]|uniref:uncharacterized protein LOC134296777 n=1 Tax=Anolis carolinensis TaxID=28377 RepID=UPI002F2B854C
MFICGVLLLITMIGIYICYPEERNTEVFLLDYHAVRMFLGGCTFALLLGSVGVCLCYDTPAWATTGFDLPPKERQREWKREPSNVCIFGLDRFGLEMLICGALILVIVIDTAILYISRKHKKNIKASQAMTETPGALEAENEWIKHHTKMLERLLKSTREINKCMKDILHIEKKILQSQLRRRKISETENEDSIQVCADSGQEEGRRGEAVSSQPEPLGLFPGISVSSNVLYPRMFYIPGVLEI